MGRVQDHNQEIRYKAEYRASEMQLFPSKLEEKMQRFLDEHCIDYEPQKVFYITEDDGWILRYYIADFYIPHANLIIEVDGKFHDKQLQHDKTRTKTIQEYYPNVRILRYRWKDLSDYSKMEALLEEIS